MRIVLLHYFPSGSNPVYPQIAAAMRALGHEVYIAEAGSDGSLIYRGLDGVILQVAGPNPTRVMGSIPGVSMLSERLRFLQFMGRVRKSIKQIAPDIVQVNPFLMAWTLPLFMPPKIHFVLDIRQINEAVDDRLITRLRENIAILRKQAWSRLFFEKTCFCHQEAARRILGDNWKKWAEVIPVGVDKGFFQQDLDVKMHEEGQVSFVYVGTLSRLRNLENILQAAKLLRNRTDRFRVDLIGPDKSNGYYSRVLDELDIASYVAIKPAIPYIRIPSVLAKYDVGLAYTPDRPTWHYQPTIKVLEYRALGLPIISTDVASHREVVENNINGVLCGDQPQKIAEAMFKFAGDRAFLHKMTSNASTMRGGCSWLDVAGMYVDKVYEKLVLDE